MLSVRPVEQVFFPLDEELALLPGRLTPSLQESVVRLGTWLPFGPTAAMLKHFTQVRVSEATARRVTERAGQAYVAVQEAVVERLEREAPAAPAGPALQQVSVDGAMVPLRGKGEWAEVKTLAIGTVGEPEVNGQGEPVVHTRELSYFSRLLEQELFARLALVETHRRGVETAGTVCGVVDGAEWAQTFLDYHRLDAVRILDWGHAAGYVAQAGKAVFGEGTAETAQWVERQLRELRHGDAETVLGKLRGLQEDLALQGGGDAQREALAMVTTSLAYLEKRVEQIRYAEFMAQGYPIGSGAVESANKVLVEARMKGAGMHWARGNVNPMVALRTIACSDRWEEARGQISARLRQDARDRVAGRRAEQRAAVLVTVEQAAVPTVAVGELVPTAATVARSAGPRTPVEPEPQCGPRRPAANHPWRRSPVGNACRRPVAQSPGAEM